MAVEVTLTTADKVEVVKAIESLTLIAGVAITAGGPVIIDPTTGKWAASNGTDAAHARTYGIASRTVAAGMPLTAIKKGLMGGLATLGAYDSKVYVNDAGNLSDTAGTVTMLVGRVVPALAQSAGTAADKLLSVEL